MTDSSARVLDARLLLSIIAAGIMSFSGVVVETAMNVTFPTLMHEFNIGTSLVQWVTTGYLLVLALIIPTSAYLKRRFATRSLFTAAISSFLAGTLLAAWSPYFNVLLIGRLLQGIGTGIALPMMFNIILEQVPGERLGFMIGIASLITAMAPAVGPSLGGMIVSCFGWRMIFVNIAWYEQKAVIVLLALLSLGIKNIRQAGKLEESSFNFGLYLLLVIGFSSLIFATSIASDFGWFSIEVLALFAICFIALTAFYKQSLSSNAPLLRVEIFRYLPYTLSTASLLLVGFICLGLGFLIPNYAQLVSHTDAFTAGCLLLPGCIIGAMLAPISGRLLDKFGAKRPILLGNTSILISVICYSLYPYELSSLLFIIFYLFFAFGQGFSMGTIMTNGLSQLPEELNADGNAAMNTLLQLAGAVGTAVISTIVATAQAAEPANIAHATMLGSRHGFYVLAVSAVLILCCSLKVFALIKNKQLAHA
jgi:DHA2 family lincomycin resistance protein-like MFS transporter